MPDSDDMIVLTAEEYRRMGRAVRDFETRPRRIPPTGLKDPLPSKGKSEKWVDVENFTSPEEEIPERSIVKISTFTMVDDTLYFRVIKPDEDNIPVDLLLITDDTAIPARNDDNSRGRGKATFWPTWVQYEDVGDDTLDLGTQASSFKVHNNQYGFRRYARNAVSSGDIRAYVWRKPIQDARLHAYLTINEGVNDQIITATGEDFVWPATGADAPDRHNGRISYNSSTGVFTFPKIGFVEVYVTLMLCAESAAAGVTDRWSATVESYGDQQYRIDMSDTTIGTSVVFHDWFPTDAGGTYVFRMSNQSSVTRNGRFMGGQISVRWTESNWNGGLV